MLHMHVQISERHGSQFSTETGQRWVSFRGSLWNSQSRLDGSEFFVKVFEGNYPYVIQQSRQRYLSQLRQQPPGPKIPETSIGVVNITPHARPSDRFEAPFDGLVFLARSDFDAALRLIDVTLDEGQLVSATLAVRSDQLDQERIYHPIDEIDLSSGFQGFVFQFCVNRTLGRRIPTKQRPVSLPDTYARKPATNISVAVHSVYVSYSMPAGYVSDLSCEGSPRFGSRGQFDERDCAACSVTFHEYDRQDDGRYPKESLSGGFAWHKETRSLSINLWYRQADLRGPLAPLIFTNASDSVRIEAVLLTDVAEFKSSDQHGEISYWSVRSVHVYRKLDDAKPKLWRG
jgi:hypothetical protein